jgi:predicted metal-binding protein
MEMAMTDQDVIHWVHETLKVGTVRPKKVDPKNKKQWRWRCSFRDAYYVARLLWPYAKTKLHKIEQIIDHYSPDYVFEEKVVSLQQYREAMNLE